jgi:glycosyltransferase involved in cell wall biosynthesis
MRILVLSKRQYTGKDLLDDRYGRLFELPAALAARGHEVVGVALSYRSRAEGWRQWPDHPLLGWHSINAAPWGGTRYPAELLSIARDFRPDLIWACSDVPHALIGWWLKNRLHRPLVIDLYDNFESFGLSRLPGMTALLRGACRRADGLTLVSGTLDEYVASRYGVTAPRLVLGNGVPKGLFFPRDRHAARERLRLPDNARLIGTAGAISAGRGIADLFKAFHRLALEDQNLWLVHAGHCDATPAQHRHPRIIDLGILSQERVADLFSALNVAVVCNLDSPFGRYCFPQKLYEIIACGAPLVAASIGDVANLLQAHPECLYPPGDYRALAVRIKHHLAHAKTKSVKPITWTQRGMQLEAFFLSILGPHDLSCKQNLSSAPTPIQSEK